MGDTISLLRQAVTVDIHKMISVRISSNESVHGHDHGFTGFLGFGRHNQQQYQSPPPAVVYQEAPPPKKQGIGLGGALGIGVFTIIICWM